MRTQTQMKIFFATVLIALAALAVMSTPGRVMGSGRPKGHAVVALTQGAREDGLALHSTAQGTGSAESRAGSRFQVKRQAAAVSPPRAISFLSVVTYLSGGLAPVSVAIADVNGDGRLDAVVTNANSSTLGVLFGNGDGTFQAVVTYGSGGRSPWSVAVADVNRDGKPDLVVANSCASTCATGLVAVLLANGDGTFQAAVTYDSGGSLAQSVAVADVNGDGRLDVVVTNQASNTLGVLLGNGDGTFQPAVAYGSGGGEPSSVAVADVNGDGKLDLLVANACVACLNGGVDVLLGNGDGTFQAAVNDALAGGTFPKSVAISDVNGDGKPDLVIGSNCFSCGDSFVSVQLGNGDGSFQPSLSYTIVGMSRIFSVAVADMNGDGKPDVVLAGVFGSGGGRAGSLQGNGDGTFQAAVLYNSSGPATFVAIADVNGDEKPDLLLANAGNYVTTSTVGVLINKSVFTPTTTALGSSPNPSLVGQAVTFTAAVSSAAGAPPNGEVVTFKNGSIVLGTGSLSGGGASLTTSSLPVGMFTITASYPGNSSFGASTSSLIKQIVNPIGKSMTATAIGSSLNPSTYGQNVTWTATVTSSGSVMPTGTVRFSWSGHTIGSATLNSSGVATLTKSNLNAGTYAQTAVYMGDAANLGSTSAVLNQVVLEATSTATLTSSPNPSALGQAVTFTAKISSPTVTPRGPVTFTAGKTVLGTAQLSGGKASLTISSLAVGKSTVTVTYSGNSNIAKSSASIIQTVE